MQRDPKEGAENTEEVKESAATEEKTEEATASDNGELKD